MIVNSAFQLDSCFLVAEVVAEINRSIQGYLSKFVDFVHINALSKKLITLFA
jgi:hypothetical protein